MAVSDRKKLSMVSSRSPAHRCRAFAHNFQTVPDAQTSSVPLWPRGVQTARHRRGRRGMHITHATIDMPWRSRTWEPKQTPCHVKTRHPGKLLHAAHAACTHLGPCTTGGGVPWLAIVRAPVATSATDA